MPACTCGSSVIPCVIHPAKDGTGGAVDDRLWSLILSNLRRPTVATTDATGEAVLAFTPALTGAEQATLDSIKRFVRSGFAITFAEWQGIEDQLVTLRTFRTRTPAQWTALTQVQRDAELIKGTNALIDVLKAELRDA